MKEKEIIILKPGMGQEFPIEAGLWEWSPEKKDYGSLFLGELSQGFKSVFSSITISHWLWQKKRADISEE